MKRIGLVGYYGFGNYGDELFRYVFEENSEGLQFVTLPEVVGVRKSFLATPEQRKKFVDSVDAIFIGGGDLIRPGDKFVNHWFEEYLAKPVVVVGVGVASWAGYNDSTVDIIRNFLNHESVKYISVRDNSSKNWIEENISPKCGVEFNYDLVCAHKFPTREPDSRKILGIISWEQNDEKKLKLTRRALEKMIAKAQELGYQPILINPSHDDHFEADMKHLEELGLGGVEILSPQSVEGVTDAIGACSMIISAKFHGCVAALMMGKPAITLSKIDKFANFYRLMEREDLISGIFEKDPAKAFDHISVPIPQYFIEMARNSAVASIKKAMSYV